MNETGDYVTDTLSNQKLQQPITNILILTRSKIDILIGRKVVFFTY